MKNSQLFVSGKKKKNTKTYMIFSFPPNMHTQSLSTQCLITLTALCYHLFLFRNQRS